MTTMGPLRNAAGFRPLLDMRSNLDRLQLQLATGRRAELYSELGGGRSPSLDAREKLAAIDAYGRTSDQLNVRLSTIQTTLERFEKIRTEQRSANLDRMFEPVDGAQTASQKGAYQRFAEMLSLMNQEIDGRRLFSGRAADQDATAHVDAILDGVPPAAGLRDVIIERNRADRGADGLGRLALTTPTATSVSLADTVSGPFGFSIGGIGGQIDNATLTDNAGPPREALIDFTGVPSPDSTIRITLTLPTGDTTVVSLRATATAPGTDEFAVGPDAATTAANFRAALATSVQSKVTTDLIPRSTIAAAEDFFNVDDATAPRRVDVVTTPEAATALRAATPTDTVRWYLGDGAADNPRATAAIRVDTAVTVGYGLRGNEEAFRRVLANIGAFAAVKFNPADPDAKDAFAGLATEVRDNLGVTSGQTIRTVQSEITVAQQSVAAARDRQIQTKTLLSNLVGDIESITKEEVAARILETQTRLQAGYQATSIIAQMSLAQYL